MLSRRNIWRIWSYIKGWWMWEEVGLGSTLRLDSYRMGRTRLMMRRLLAERLAQWIRAYELPDAQNLCVTSREGHTRQDAPSWALLRGDDCGWAGLPFTCAFAETLCLQYWCGRVAIHSLNEDLFCTSLFLNAVTTHINGKEIKGYPWFTTPAVYEWPKKNPWVISPLYINGRK